MKMRKGPDGVHMFSRTTGLNVLLDEIAVPTECWSTAPRQVSVALTNTCDLRCPYCYAPKYRSQLEYEQLTAWLRELDDSGCLGVGFGGGEPTLHPDFARLCRFTSEHTGLAVTFTTHAHRLNERLVSELPAHRFGWESYHSELNQVSGTAILAPALCEQLNLVNHQGEWDLYERSGRLATIYREIKNSDDSLRSHLLYLRADLMASYLSSKLDLVWLVWGERNFHFKSFTSSRNDAFDGHTHIHRYAEKWQQGSSRPKKSRSRKK